MWKSPLRCWTWLSLFSWIGALILSLLLKLPLRRLEPWFVLWSFFLLKLLCIFINLWYSHAWNTFVMSGLVLLLIGIVELTAKMEPLLNLWLTIKIYPAEVFPIIWGLWESTLPVLVANSDQYWVKFPKLIVGYFLVDINFTDQNSYRLGFQLETPVKFKTGVISWISDLTMSYLTERLTIEHISSQN